jgi:hypothetical protein
MREGSPRQHRAPAPGFAARARGWLRRHPRVLVPAVAVAAVGILMAGISVMASPTGNDHAPLPGFPSSSVRPVDAAGRPVHGATTAPARRARGAKPNPVAGAVTPPGTIRPGRGSATPARATGGGHSSPARSTSAGATSPSRPTTTSPTTQAPAPPPPPPPSPSPTKSCLVPNPLQPGNCLVQGT